MAACVQKADATQADLAARRAPWDRRRHRHRRGAVVDSDPIGHAEGTVIALLSDQLESEVTIETLEGRVFPRVSVSGRGVVIRQKGRTDVPPLITIDEFEIRGSLRDLMQHPRQVGEVRLQGLQVKIPPGDDDDDADEAGEVRGSEAGRRPQPAAGHHRSGSRRPTRSSR